MVIFDRGDQILKRVDFKKDPALLMYQLKNAETVPDRADAAAALGVVRGSPDVVAALGDAAQHDPFWGVRVEALRALGRIGGPDAEKQILAALSDAKPWVRDVATRELGFFGGDTSLPSRLAEIESSDPAYRVRAAALEALASIKAPDAYDMLTAAVKSDSPNDILGTAALSAFGLLGDDRSVSILLDWSAPGKPLHSRQAAIGALAGIDKKNKSITKALLSYLNEPYFDVRLSAIFALGARGDSDALGPLEDMLKGGQLTQGEEPYIEGAIAMLKGQNSGR
jgi:aminopeptidase N